MGISNKEELTPLMKQYFAIKDRYRDTLVLFQVGDFYELFFDDAKEASSFLGIALTKRGKLKGAPIPLCGVPLHALDYYLAKLIRGGFKVAICNQLEEAKPGTVVERGVTQVLTPGTLTDSKLLDDKSASYLFSFFPTKSSWGMLFGELLTAQLFATILPAGSNKTLESELVRFFPDEILIPAGKEGKVFHNYFKSLGYFTSAIDFKYEDAQEVACIDMWLKRQFQAQAQKKIETNDSLRLALYNFYAYVRRNQEAALDQFVKLNFYKPEDFLVLDSATQRNLELIKNNHDYSGRHTLFSVMDGAVTAMGSRTIKKWLVRPLMKHDIIEQRLETVQIYMQDIAFMQKLEELLVQIGDIERIIGRIALFRASFNDYRALLHALSLIPEIFSLVRQKAHGCVLLRIICSNIVDFSSLAQLLAASLNDDLTKDYIIKDGFDQELDDLRILVQNGNQQFLLLEQREQKATGINSLKVRYNQVHGYYIEVTKANIQLVPDYYIRQQTLVGRERFTTPELQQLQHNVLRAKSEIEQVEKNVFDRIKREVAEHVTTLRKLTHAMSYLDALLGFARIAYNNGYTRPIFNNNRNIVIVDARHPVVERTLQHSFIPNDVSLIDDESLWIITGPNMGGKSTYLRSIALICIMAQCGSFVPAKNADLALLDRIFTRIGAGDNVAEGKSTFLVEMEETASICTQATKQSLVILDEVGRGTSTFDGLALAQAVVEYIYSTIQARCLFATHYHELTLLKNHFPGIQSYYASSKKRESGILFLYRIVKGVADGSFGIEVAKLAALPEAVVQRAEEILTTLKDSEVSTKNALLSNLDKEVLLENGTLELDDLIAQNRALQLALEKLQKKIEMQDEKLATLETLDWDDLSPRKAFDLLWKIREK